MLVALSFPPFDLPFLSLVALVPLAFAFLELRPRCGTDALVLGGVFGVVQFGIVLLWIVPALSVETRFAPAAYLLVVSAAALVPAASVHWAHRLRYAWRMPAWLAFAAAWVAGEWLRGHVGPLSFPWLGLAASLSEHPSMLAPARWLGESGVSFAIVTANFAVVTLVPGTGSDDPAWRRLMPAAVALLVFFGAGWTASRDTAGRATDVLGPRLRIAVLTTDFPIRDQSGSPSAGDRLDLLGATLRDALGDGSADVVPGVDLVVLPEAFVPVPWSRAPFVERELRSQSERLQAPFVVGTLREDTDGGLHNAVASVGSGPTDFIDKHKRVPWVESGFAPGGGIHPLRAGPHSLAVLICFEAAFGGLAAGLVRAGGMPVLNLTSDAWFPDRGVGSWGRAQQIAHLPLRAVELGTAVVRAANRGTSMAFDARGRVRGSSREPGIEVFTVPATSTQTLFARTGDLLGPSALVLSLIAMFWGAVEPARSRTLY